MSDFGAAGLLWGVLVLFIFASASIGHEIGIQSIEKQCNTFGSMSINENLYHCKIIQK